MQGSPQRPQRIFLAFLREHSLRSLRFKGLALFLAPGASGFRLSSSENPAVSALHPIVRADDANAHAHFLRFWRKANFLITTLQSHARLQVNRAARIIRGHGHVESQ